MHFLPLIYSCKIPNPQQMEPNPLLKALIQAHQVEFPLKNSYLMTPAYKITNSKLASMYIQNRDKIFDSLMRGNRYIELYYYSRFEEFLPSNKARKLSSTISEMSGYQTIDPSSIMGITKDMKKMMNKKQLLSLEVSKKLLKNVPGIIHEGEQLPVPDQKVLRRLHNSQKSLHARSVSKQRIESLESINREKDEAKRKKKSLNRILNCLYSIAILQTSHMKNLQTVLNRSLDDPKLISKGQTDQDTETETENNQKTSSKIPRKTTKDLLRKMRIETMDTAVLYK